MSHPTLVARDCEEFHFRDRGQDWVASWHPPDLPPPDGKRHGSAGICFTSDGDVVLVRWDGSSWEFPGGRPEGDEDWRATLDREVLEEACASVEEAMLLGFSKGACISGPENGLVLVRSLWRAVVSLHPWDPQHETTQRLVVPSNTAVDRINPDQDRRPVYQRWFHEARADSVDVRT